MKTRDWIELVLLAAVWGASFLFQRIAVPEFGAVALVELRVVIAAVFLLAVLAWRGGLSGLRQAARPLAIAGPLNSGIPFVLFAYSTHYVTAGVAALVNAAVPLFAAVVAYLWLRERLTPARTLGVAVGFAGVLVLVWDKASFASGSGTGWAIAAGLLASACYGVAVNYAKKGLTGVPSLVAATGSMIASTLLLLPLTFFTWPDVTPSLRSWLAVIALGVACTAFAFILYFRLIARIGPTKTTSVTYLIPVFGMVWGLLFLGEPITTSMFVSCGIILLGTALATGSVSFASRAARDSVTATSRGT
jgi:drug/metabolite transporter (DMT)-like permease